MRLVKDTGLRALLQGLTRSGVPFLLTLWPVLRVSEPTCCHDVICRQDCDSVEGAGMLVVAIECPPDLHKDCWMPPPPWLQIAFYRCLSSPPIDFCRRVASLRLAARRLGAE